VRTEETEIPRDERRSSRGRSPKTSSRHLDENETEVLYMMGSTGMTLTAGIPDSPPLGSSKLSPKKYDTTFSVANEKSRSPRHSRHSLSQPKEVDFDVRAKGGSLSHSPRKIRSRSSIKERKGIIMNPKSPGMGYDSRKSPHSNASHHTSSDEESKALLMGAVDMAERKVTLNTQAHIERVHSLLMNLSGIRLTVLYYKKY